MQGPKDKLPTRGYSANSPYIELLQSKKKVYGLRYSSNLPDTFNYSKNSSNSSKRPPSSSGVTSHSKSFTHVKSSSSQKERFHSKSTMGKQSQKRKRVYTEQGQLDGFQDKEGSGVEKTRFNKSLFILPEDDDISTKQINSVFMEPKQNQSTFEPHQGSKSLFYSREETFSGGSSQNYLRNFEFLKRFSEFKNPTDHTLIKGAAEKVNKKQELRKNSKNNNFSASKSNKSNKSAKQKHKSGKIAGGNHKKDGKLSVQQRSSLDPHKGTYKRPQTHSIHFSTLPVPTPDLRGSKDEKGVQILDEFKADSLMEMFRTVGFLAQKLSSTEVQELIRLIQDCVQEANQYILLLNNKVSTLKAELLKEKAEGMELENIIRDKNKQLAKKDAQIHTLQETLRDSQQHLICSGQKNGEGISKKEEKNLKRLIEVIDQLNDENCLLQAKVNKLEKALVQSNPYFPTFDIDRLDQYQKSAFPSTKICKTEENQQLPLKSNFNASQVLKIPQLLLQKRMLVGQNAEESRRPKNVEKASGNQKQKDTQKSMSQVVQKVVEKIDDSRQKNQLKNPLHVPDLLTSSNGIIQSGQKMTQPLNNFQERSMEVLKENDQCQLEEKVHKPTGEERMQKEFIRGESKEKKFKFISTNIEKKVSNLRKN